MRDPFIYAVLGALLNPSSIFLTSTKQHSEDIPNTKEFITMWYSQLNSLPLTAAQKQEIIDEANYVFTLNIELFEELEGSPVDAVLALVADSLLEGLRKTNPWLRPWISGEFQP